MIHSQIKALEKGLEVGQEKKDGLEVDQGIEDDDLGLEIEKDGLGREIEVAEEGAGLEIEEVEAVIGLVGIEEVDLPVEKVRKKQLIPKHSVKTRLL